MDSTVNYSNINREENTSSKPFFTWQIEFKLTIENKRKLLKLLDEKGVKGKNLMYGAGEILKDALQTWEDINKPTYKDMDRRMVFFTDHQVYKEIMNLIDTIVINKTDAFNKILEKYFEVKEIE